MFWELIQIDKSDGAEKTEQDVPKAIARIAGHLGCAVSDVYDQLHSTGRVETDFSIYEKRVL